ncbi:MAG TPA: leucyl/phenylalanyl-tRNA--protein transferase [Campylobacterales bacterium]|nr:leucyl/phenylalanyl-tRNA--protein transferase [Campylobacterales bacterium]
MIPQVSRYSYIFPNPREASKEGLVAWGGDLNPNRILSAYRQGIFPWYNENDPILWWSPDPRLVLFFDDLKISKSLNRNLKKYEVRFDTNFEEVIKKCRDIRLLKDENTWILEEVIEQYIEIHEMGFAMSVETYHEGELIGGLYGILMGGVFCGESMFSLKSDASKVALVKLADKLQSEGYDFIDCQVPSEHLKSMGAREIGRDEFLELLEKALIK